MRGVGVFKPLEIETYQYPHWVRFRYRLHVSGSLARSPYPVARGERDIHKEEFLEMARVVDRGRKR